jgi:hypothetical protein
VILDEFFISGEVQETSKNRVMNSIKKMQECEALEILEIERQSYSKRVL